MVGIAAKRQITGVTDGEDIDTGVLQLNEITGAGLVDEDAGGIGAGVGLDTLGELDEVARGQRTELVGAVGLHGVRGSGHAFHRQHFTVGRTRRGTTAA